MVIFREISSCLKYLDLFIPNNKREIPLLVVRFVMLNLSRRVTESASQRCSQKKVFWKYAINLQEDTYAEVWFQWSCKARTPLDGCFWSYNCLNKLCRISLHVYFQKNQFSQRHLLIRQFCIPIPYYCHVQLRASHSLK